ncbi:hypothetical protein C8A03DRAFT_18699, partial [Achaetomium macrosporum]
MLPSGILRDKDESQNVIAPVGEAIARARYECRDFRDKSVLRRIAYYIRAFHDGVSQATKSSWAHNKRSRRLKHRLTTVLKKIETGVVTRDLPEPEEILAFRYCSPTGATSGTMAAILAEIGIAHY